MNAYRCIIVDDEPLARNVIRKFLQDLEHFEVIGEVSNAIEAFTLMEQEHVDLIFLDIKMPEITGIDFIKTLENKPGIIITTAYREYAVEGFELDVTDYLVKPIAFPRFIKALNKFVRSKSRPTKDQSDAEPSHIDIDHIFIKVNKRIVKTYYDEILFIESLKDYVRIVTETEELITHSNLSGFMVNLPQSEFIRIHKSFAVSKSKIKALEGNQVEVRGRKLPIGRNYQQEIKKIILTG